MLISGQSEEIRFRTTKARDLLAYLIQHRGVPAPKDRLLEAMWPDLDPDQASTLFHTHLYHLRKAMNRACGTSESVLHMGGRYMLASGLVVTDVQQFEAMGNPHDNETPESAVVRLREAVSVYRGEYLDGVDYDWVMAERERLRLAYLAILEDLANRLMDAGEYREAAGCLRAIVRINPLLEEIHAQLMLVYARMGDRMAVTQQYETLCRALNDELGVGPAPRTRDLYYHLCSEGD